MGTNWWRLQFEIHQKLEDLIIYELNKLDIYSFAFTYSNKINNIRKLNIWLPEISWPKYDRQKLEDKLINLCKENDFNNEKISWDLIEEENWLHNWKKYWQPQTIAKDFLILPCWMNLPRKFDNKTVIRIDPGAAFGTGQHPSTHLCLEIIEEICMKNKRILDVGCGSGILTIAAKKNGAKEVHSIDNDYLAINSTKENFKLNFGTLDSLRLIKGSFPEINNAYLSNNYDVIVCNILAEVIKKMIPSFYERLKPEGNLILSGILCSQKEEIIKILNLFNFKLDNVLSKQDWICLKAFK
tara:strand:- start:1261 stop:2154 length:894 start_codon:yes stop_codon:yes gene_type:complete